MPRTLPRCHKSFLYKTGYERQFPKRRRKPLFWQKTLAVVTNKRFVVILILKKVLKLISITFGIILKSIAN